MGQDLVVIGLSSLGSEMQSAIGRGRVAQILHRLIFRAFPEGPEGLLVPEPHERSERAHRPLSLDCLYSLNDVQHLAPIAGNYGAGALDIRRKTFHVVNNDLPNQIRRHQLCAPSLSEPVSYSSRRRTQNGPRPFSSRPFGTISR